MRQIATVLVATIVASAALAGAGFGSVTRHAATADLGAFGGPVAHPHVVRIWREGSSVASPPLRQVRCETAGSRDAATCFAAR